MVRMDALIQHQMMPQIERALSIQRDDAVRALSIDHGHRVQGHCGPMSPVTSVRTECSGNVKHLNVGRVRVYNIINHRIESRNALRIAKGDIAIDEHLRRHKGPTAVIVLGVTRCIRCIRCIR